ncbi:MAG TPA: pyridoxamine 5'-phosphate oxidase family protein [Ramlibacter sp.]|jgi:hypothetical protein|nr:pyridoxamine 5'-phosphate oxidase family protein [Ramlibacter sp.]
MAAQLPPELLAFMARGVSVIVASRDAKLRPSIMRAVGSRVEAQGQDITVFLSRPQSRQLLQDLAATGQVAVVFSEPSTHRSVQLKASRVELRPATADDAPALARYLASMETELQQIGYFAGLAGALLAHKLEEVIAVRFTPEQAYEQTPGPRAGTALGSRT